MTLGNKEQAKLARVLRKIQPVMEIRSLVEDRSFFRELFHPPLVKEIERKMVERDFPLPLGCWLEPLLASTIARVKGVGAIDEVLGWLALSRWTYGYAWRVLVDWRHLESVKDHPAFVEFLRKEDELVEEIESKIDEGVYPL